MRLHLVGLPHTETTREYLTCAYTQKLVKFCDMMTARGHELYLYAGEDNEAACAEHIPCVTRDERVRWFGEWDLDDAFSRITWDNTKTPWLAMNGRAAAAIEQRKQPGDLLLCLTGAQQPLANAVAPMIAVEWAVGYPATFAGCVAYESHVWQHYLYGTQDPSRTAHINGNWYHAVVPNFFDRDAFHLAEEKGDYLLYIGRLIGRKGLVEASMVAERLERRLVVAGPGAQGVTAGTGREKGVTRIHIDNGIVVQGRHLEYVGPVGLEERADLMANASALLAPTQYIEPFGGVAVEGMFSGTPAITSDWGAFVETVIEGVSGYRFHTIEEACEAVAKAELLDPATIREYADNRYSFDAVAPQFERWLAQVATLYERNWDGTPVAAA